MDFIKLMNAPQYDFLRENERLGKRILLLGLGGSYAYGTDNENSDIDFRGVTLNLPSDLLGLTEFEQYEDGETDTVIYSFNKIIRLLLECNPNTCEILGLDDDQYLILHPLGRELIDRAPMFLSKRAVKSFGGYASDQLRRLKNALARNGLPQAQKEQHILSSASRVLEEFQKNYSVSDHGTFRLYVDEAVNPRLEKEIFADIHLRHFPLRDYERMYASLAAVVRAYDKAGRVGQKDDNHLNKHAMHLIRLFMMGIDILEKGQIRTKRSEDLELLLKIRTGSFLREDQSYAPEFFDIMDDYEKKFEKAARESTLPEQPDMEQVEAFVEYVNKKAIEGDF